MSVEEIEKFFVTKADRLAYPTKFAENQRVEDKYYLLESYFTRNHNDLYGGKSHTAVLIHETMDRTGDFVEAYWNHKAYIRPCIWVTVL